MRIAPCGLVLALSLLIISAPGLAADDQRARDAHEPAAEALAFNDFYVMPVGPLGLEPTARLRSLHGKRVRLVGYMVHEEEPSAGVFMLAPRPVQLAEVADGPADDLPASTVFVHVPTRDLDHVVRYRAGLWTLTGTLELGAQAESNGRVSYTRLRLDPGPDERATATHAHRGQRPRS